MPADMAAIVDEFRGAEGLSKPVVHFDVTHCSGLEQIRVFSRFVPI